MESNPERDRNCDKVQALLPLFADGELDAGQMRMVATHSAACPLCDREVREQERLQFLLRAHIASRLAAASTVDLWPGIEARLRREATPRWRKWSRAMRDVSWQPRVLWPALAALLIAALATALYWQRAGAPGLRGATLLAGAEPPAFIDSLEADVGSVAVMDDWENHTTVLWVSDEPPVTGGFQQ